MADRFSINDTLLGIRAADVDGRQGFLIGTAVVSPAGEVIPLVDTDDGATSPDATPPVASFPKVFNGVSYDRLRGDTNGLVVQPALSATFWNYAPPAGGIVNSTAGVTVAPAVAGRNYIKSLQLTADALGVATEFVIRDGAAGTVLARVKVNTGGLAASGTTIFDPPLRGSTNTLVQIQTVTATVTGGVFANLQGYVGN